MDYNFTYFEEYFDDHDIESQFLWDYVFYRMAIFLAPMILAGEPDTGIFVDKANLPVFSNYRRMIENENFGVYFAMTQKMLKKLKSAGQQTINI